MAEQDPVEPGQERTAARLRDRSWSFGNVVAACVAALLIGGLVGASLGALVARDDDHAMMRHVDRRAPQWPGHGPGRMHQWRGMPDGPGGPGRLSEEERQELRDLMREWMQQRRGQVPSPSPTPAPSPSAPAS